MTLNRQPRDQRRAERRRLQSLADRLPSLTKRQLLDLLAGWRRQAADRRRRAFHVV